MKLIDETVQKRFPDFKKSILEEITVYFEEK